MIIINSISNESLIAKLRENRAAIIALIKSGGSK